MQNNIYNFSAKTIDGKQKSFADYEGKVLLIVNVASYCGFTPQYKQLQELYSQYHEQGFEVLAFPCNQFAGQEPDDGDYIEKFCELTYGTTFTVFAKIDVNGNQAEPLFGYLKSNCPGLFGTEVIKWNFTKFLVGVNGIPIRRYAPIISPKLIAKDIEKLLSEKTF